jgi:hypothetical protein
MTSPERRISGVMRLHHREKRKILSKSANSWRLAQLEKEKSFILVRGGDLSLVSADGGSSLAGMVPHVFRVEGTANFFFFFFFFFFNCFTCRLGMLAADAGALSP